MAFTREEAEERIRALREYSLRTYKMMAEAAAQWLESCLECGDEYLDQDLDELESDAHFWAESMADDWGYSEVYPHWFISEDSIFMDEEGHWKGSPSTWIVWAVADDDTSEFHHLMHQHCIKEDLPIPQWFSEQT